MLLSFWDILLLTSKKKLANCSELYSGNVASDSSKFNIVFIGNGFRTIEDLKSAAKRVIDMDGTSSSETISYGLMQIPIFKNNKNKFNFWYIDYTKSFSSKDSATVWKELYNFDLIKSCQDILPNRVIPVFIYPAQVISNEKRNDCNSQMNEMDCLSGFYQRDKWCVWDGLNNECNVLEYPYASYGRYYVTLSDCIDLESNCNGEDYPNLQNNNIHELLHTIPCLGDEYGTFGNNPQLISMQPIEFNSLLTSNANLQFYVGNYEQCIANAPWINEGYLGNGCGNDGTVDCFDESKCNQPIKFVNGIDTQPGCCISGKDCTMEIGCFEGGVYTDKGIWRSSSSSVLRNPYLGKLTGSQFISEWDQEIVYRVIQKGPAIGKVWKEGQNYDLDCDITNIQFID